MFDFDPSKMDPATLMELSRLIQQLPPEKLNQMQTLMHNMAAGFDVRAQMEDLEKSLPPGFREKLVAVVATSGAANAAQASTTTSAVTPATETQLNTPSGSEMDVREARLTILRAVAEGRINAEEALMLLFPS